MENTSNNELSIRDLNYYRQRYKNRVFTGLVEFFAKEAETLGVTKRDLAARLQRDPSQITRWLSSPSNLTLETISDLLFALGAEAEPPTIVSFRDRRPANYMHPLLARAVGVEGVRVSESQRVSTDVGGAGSSANGAIKFDSAILEAAE
ncbi:MAG: helix-turn-helix transcriptional regulator [Alphaproteobacteria bacterium]|nr:helix-turn-helix transcriptional regulator [Alphaproteobacteria bacterium]